MLIHAGRWCLRHVAIVMLAVLSLAEGIAAKEPKARPNIVLLVSDDQRPDTIHALGNEVIRTPSLDRLVREGLAFRRAITAYPICVSSRAEILSGACSLRTGIPYRGNAIAAELRLWPEVMRAAGYQTWYVGKWHTNGTPHARGYVETDGWYGSGQESGKPYLDHQGRQATGYRGWQFRTNEGARQPELGAGLTPDISRHFADAAIRFIDRRTGPFFLHVNFTAPHDPLLLPPGFERAYDPANMLLPGNFRAEHPFNHGNASGRDEVIVPAPRTQVQVRIELACYYALIEHLDQQVGRILNALERTGQAENTIVIYTSDHGLALGSHGLMGKQNMYEHTIGVPLVIRGPGVPRGETTDAQCYLRDLFPTTCDWIGLEVPQTVEGRSLLPVIRGEQEKAYDFTVACFTNTQRMLRDDRWKLVRYPEARRVQLFDLQSDPLELHDLSDAPEQAERVSAMSRQLNDWLVEHGDPIAPLGP